MSPEALEAIKQLIDAAEIAEAELTSAGKPKVASRVSRAILVVRVMLKL